MTLQTKTGQFGQNSALPTYTLIKCNFCAAFIAVTRTAGLLNLKRKAREQDARKLTKVLIKALLRIIK